MTGKSRCVTELSKGRHKTQFLQESHHRSRGSLVSGHAQHGFSFFSWGLFSVTSLLSAGGGFCCTGAEASAELVFPIL